MPATNYMLIDPRRDHAMRVPRPDLSKRRGSPDACTQCHAGKAPEWAASALDGGADAGAPDAAATAAARPRTAAGSGPRGTHRGAGDDRAGRSAQSYPRRRQLLADPVRGVRIEAARVLAGVPEKQIPESRRDAYRRALDEYIAVQRQEADWPTANLNLGNLYLRLGRADEAVAAYRQAVKLDPQFASAWANLADAWRAQGREDEVEATLRQGLARLPRSADLSHALGLAQVRKGDRVAALASLAQAAKLAPDRARYAYVWAVALHSAGRSKEAIAALRDADRRYPYDVDILGALVSFNREAGDTRAALGHARKLAEALPDDPQVKALVAELARGR